MSLSYVASWQRRCPTCSTTFFDTDAIDQLTHGEQHHLPMSSVMANGEMFIGRDLQSSIEIMMTKGMGGATIANVLNVKARHRPYPTFDELYGTITAQVSDSAPATLRPTYQYETPWAKIFALPSPDLPVTPSRELLAPPRDRTVFTH